MRTDNRALLVFMRYPEPGRVKTRLAAALGPQKAAEVYEKLLRRTLGVVSEFQLGNPAARVMLFHAPEDPPERVATRFCGRWEFHRQEGEHLGARMGNALRKAFSTGAGAAVLIGSDIADIEPEDLEEAFRKTVEGTAALGPARDGGFYLIGLRKPCDAPFRFGRWGTGEVFSRTARALSGSGFRVRAVRQRRDVDRPGDFAALAQQPVFRAALSIVVPTLRGPDEISPLLETLQDALWPGDQIVVAQGRPAPKYSARSLSGSLLHVRSPRGRGIQQNAGAMLAGGDILFFLHDDTRPPSAFPYLIRRACLERNVAAGCFRLAFSPSSRALDLIARWANVRSLAFGLPYGDQGLFCRREVFGRAGGFLHGYLMEDVDLVRRLKKLGKLAVLAFPVRTSPERYLRKGVLSASVQNHGTMLRWLLGAEEGKLLSRYYGKTI